MKVWFTLTKGYVCQAMGIVHIDRICHYVTLHEMNDIFWTISQYSCVLNIDEWMDKAECTKYISYEFLFNKLNNAYKARRNLNVYVITKLYTPLHEMCCLSEPKKTNLVSRMLNVKRRQKAWEIVFNEKSYIWLTFSKIFSANRWIPCDFNERITIQKIDCQQLDWVLWVRVMVSDFVCVRADGNVDKLIRFNWIWKSSPIATECIMERYDFCAARLAHS